MELSISALSGFVGMFLGSKNWLVFIFPIKSINYKDFQILPPQPQYKPEKVKNSHKPHKHAI